MIELKSHPEGTVLPVRAQPGARRGGILGERAGALRVAITAAPERGKANEALRTALAEVLQVKASQVILLSGDSSRDKRFLIRDARPDELRAALASLCGGEAAAGQAGDTE
jgi:uncharacterized protein (TIGR00251 family)